MDALPAFPHLLSPFVVVELSVVVVCVACSSTSNQSGSCFNKIKWQSAQDYESYPGTYNKCNKSRRVATQFTTALYLLKLCKG